MFYLEHKLCQTSTDLRKFRKPNGNKLEKKLKK